MSRAEKAGEYLLNAYNCAQSVIMAYAEKYDVDEATALRITAAYGAGMADGTVCGAVSGGVAVVGMKYGPMPDSEPAEKINCYMKAKEFMDAFKAEKGTVLCSELLGTDLPYFSEEGQKYLEENQCSMKVCMPAVQFAAEILEKQGY